MEENKGLRILNVVLSVLTLLLIVTAMSKLVMYIDVYGLTVNRILPQTFMISMTPLQRHMTPAMDKLSSTAESAPSRAASATASRFPVARPKPRDSTTMAVQIQAIAMHDQLPSLELLYSLHIC